MDNTEDMTGNLHLIIGPMFSGKTSKLIHLYNDFVQQNKKVAVINYIGDKRYHNSKMSTHDNIMVDCTNAEHLSDIIINDDIMDAQIILINEGQFFTDLFEVTIKLVEEDNKTVYICGLDGDFKRKKFGNMLDLIPLCDTITKLHANCNNCNNPAMFSHRVSNETAQVLIGSIDYIPLCRTCYCMNDT